MGGIQDKKGLDAFVARMAAGKSKAAAARASSTAPPSAPPKPKGPALVPQEAKAAGNASPVAKMPRPAKAKAVGHGMNITINVTSKG